MSFFSAQREKYKVYVVGESKHTAESISIKENLEALHIKVLPPIDSFSISAPLKTRAAAAILNGYIAKYKIDLVHILFATPHALWANYIHIPYIITTRGSDALIVLPALSAGSGLRGIYDRWLLTRFRKAFDGARANTSTSLAQAAKLKELLGIDNIEIVRTGVDVERIARSRDRDVLDMVLQGKKFVFSPRFMSPIYDIAVQIEAISQLPKEILEKYIFVFIRGRQYNAEYYERMKKKLEALKEALHIKYLIKEYLNQEELWTYYNYASLTVMTPTSDGTPNSALEAMAAKCPLIMPDLAYDKAIFDETCYVLKSNNSKHLASMMESALSGYPAALLDRGYQRASELGNRTIEMNKLEKLYH